MLSQSACPAHVPRFRASRQRPQEIALTQNGNHALRGDRFKYINYYGLWDINELYDLKDDPLESRNLINDPKHKEVVARMREQLFGVLEKTGGMSIPLKANRWGQQNLRHEDKAMPADFPPSLIKKP